MANGYGQLGSALTGGGVLPAAIAEAQGESLGANTQAAIAEAQGRFAKNEALRNIGPAAATFAAAPDASAEGQAKLGQALALAAQAGVTPETFTKGVHGNQENNSYNTIVNPETPDAIVARHLAAEGREGGIIKPTAAGEAATNILHPDQGVQTTSLGQALIPAKAGLLNAQAAAATSNAGLADTKAAHGGFAGGPQGKPPSGTQWANGADGSPILDGNGRPTVVPISGGPKDPETPQPMGAVTARYFNASMNAGLQGATALSNVMRQPGTSTVGLFNDLKAGHNPIEALVRNAATKVTPEEDQTLQTIMTGLAQNMATADNSGRAANQTLVDSMGRIALQPGNTVGARFLKLAEARQVLENGLQSWADTTSLNSTQKAALEDHIKVIRSAIPFTVADVQTALSQGTNAPTLGDRARTFLHLPAGGAAPGATGAPPGPAGAAPTSTGYPGNAIPTFDSEQEAEAAGLKPGTKVIVGGRAATWQ